MGPTCFVIFIKDIDDVLNLVDGFAYKFVDDTKYGRVVLDDDDREAMQNDINKLMEWAETSFTSLQMIPSMGELYLMMMIEKPCRTTLIS